METDSQQDDRVNQAPGKDQGFSEVVVRVDIAYLTAALDNRNRKIAELEHALRDAADAMLTARKERLNSGV